MHEVERNDVEHFVGDHHAANLLGKLVEPHEAIELLRETLGDAPALAIA